MTNEATRTKINVNDVMAVCIYYDYVCHPTMRSMSFNIDHS